MRSGFLLAVIALSVALGGCAMAVGNTEGLLEQAGFKKLPADTPQRAQHLQTIRSHRLIKRKADGKSYYVYADPDYCKCLYVGSENAYATYKTLLKQQDEAVALEEEREQEAVEGVK